MKARKSSYWWVLIIGQFPNQPRWSQRQTPQVGYLWLCHSRLKMPPILFFHGHGIKYLCLFMHVYASIQLLRFAGREVNWRPLSRKKRQSNSQQRYCRNPLKFRNLCVAQGCKASLFEVRMQKHLLSLVVRLGSTDTLFWPPYRVSYAYQIRIRSDTLQIRIRYVFLEYPKF